MSGPLVALVMHHGPDDYRAYAVAAVIAEDMHHVGDTASLTIPDLMRLTRLGRTSVVAGVRVLREDGWVYPVLGGGRGVANRYRLRAHEKLSTCSETCRHATGLVESALGKGVATRQVNDLNVSPRDLNVSPRDTTSVPLNPSVPRAEVDEPMPGVLVAAKTGRTDELDDYAKAVLADVPVGARPRDRAGLTQVLDAARAGGWPADRLRADLAAERHDYQRIRGGAVLASLASLATRPAPRPAWVACGECSNGWIEDERTGLPVDKCPCHPAYGGAPAREQKRSNGEPRRGFPDMSKRLAKHDPFKSRRGATG